MEKEVPISSISMRCMISATKNIQIYGSKKNESRALVQMLENIKSPAKTIILADRGYETYHAFVICTKDISRKGGIAYGFRLPDRELDKDLEFFVTRSTVHSKRDPVRYKKISPRSVFDFLDLEKIRETGSLSYEIKNGAFFAGYR